MSLKFTTERRAEDVEIDGVTYVLREATGEEAAKYRNHQMRNARIVDGKDGQAMTLGDHGDGPALLVSLCLVDTLGKPVPLATVKSWPARIVAALAERAEEISDLGQKATREALERRLAYLQAKLGEMDGEAEKN